jgi:hypothetical protein
MTDGEDDIVRALRRALPPRGDAPPPRDLWPDVAHRLASPRAPVSRGDWALAGAAALWLLVFPQGIVALLYLL